MAARGWLRIHPVPLRRGSQLSHPVDAYFEGMSGFTTTGASVVTDFDEINRSLGIWRQFTQWLGGMGIIVLAIAVLPRLRIGGRQLMESELPGPEIAALSERIRSTARRLWFLYVALTALQTLMLTSLWLFGIDELMTPYQALAHSFSTMPTGGFSTQPRSAEGFSAESQWILALFMLIAGANFALMYRAVVRRRPHPLARDEEFRLYIALAVVATAAVTAMLWGYGIAEAKPRSGRRSSRPSRSCRRRGWRVPTSPSGRRSFCLRFSRSCSSGARRVRPAARSRSCGICFWARSFAASSAKQSVRSS